jgi:hypothetical protein
MARLTKSTHFIPIKTRYNVSKLAELYVQHVLRLHGPPLEHLIRSRPIIHCKFLEEPTLSHGHHSRL